LYLLCLHLRRLNLRMKEHRRELVLFRQDFLEMVKLVEYFQLRLEL
jgi:hypothetical protein